MSEADVVVRAREITQKIGIALDQAGIEPDSYAIYALMAYALGTMKMEGAQEQDVVDLVKEIWNELIPVEVDITDGRGTEERANDHHEDTESTPPGSAEESAGAEPTVGDVQAGVDES